MAEIAIPEAGTVLAGKYRVERLLGMGGMAFVLEATHLTLGQRVAIKVLQGELGKLDEMTRRFAREAQIAAQLPPDHVARVFDFGTLEGGEPYLVMELLVGRDLDQELEARGPLPVEEAVDYVLQACEGVAEAHAVGLVHRDLKPDNLFLTRRRDGSPLVKVLDFGISKADSKDGDLSLTKTSSSFGTPLYMSPEQIQSVKNVDARCDQHALGAILYALLTDSPPFYAETLTALSVIIATHPAPSAREKRPEVPAGLDAAIQKALAKRADDRFRDVADFANAIAPFGGPLSGRSAAATSRVLGSVPAPAPPTSIEPRASGSAPGVAAQQTNVGVTRAVDQARPKRSWLALAGAAIAVFVALGVVGYATLERRAGEAPVSKERVAAPGVSAGPTAPPVPEPAASTGAPAVSAAAAPAASPSQEASAEPEPEPKPAESAEEQPPPRGGSKKPVARPQGPPRAPRAAPPKRDESTTRPTPPATATASPAAKPKKPVEVFGEM
jgi:eukaryotic-like serine/threonine-protein kinase